MTFNLKRTFLMSAAILGLGVATMNNTTNVKAENIKYDNVYGANQNYRRYEATDMTLNNADVISSKEFDLTANEASDNSYVSVKQNGSVDFVAKEGADGLTVRYTVPDGSTSKISVLVNGKKVKTFNLDSKWAWQYVDGDNVYDSPRENGHARFRFDEVHGFFGVHVNKGDHITIQNEEGSLGLDFVELENVEAPKKQPANSISLADFGAKSGQDSTQALKEAIKQAREKHKVLYIPEGQYLINDKIGIDGDGLTITGAGMWYTDLHFTSNEAGKGGFNIGHDSNNLTFSHFSMSSELTSRYQQNAQYKAFAGSLGKNSKIDSLWIEHFECGAWIGDYANAHDMKYTDGLVIENSRIRNNLADGVNFAQGTKNSVVRNSNVRGNGDDSLASWASIADGTESAITESNVFEHNTIELGWRAGGIGIFGGKNHKITNNLIKDNRGGAGIRISTVFDGHNFDLNDNGVEVNNNQIVKSGTTNDFYGLKRGSFDFERVKGDIRNIGLNNNNIVDGVVDDVTKNFELTNESVKISNNTHSNDKAIQNINQLTHQEIYEKENYTLYYFDGEHEQDGKVVRYWTPKSSNIKIESWMTYSNSKGKKVYNFTNEDVPSFLPEEKTKFLKDYVYQGEQEKDGNIIRFWSKK